MWMTGAALSSAQMAEQPAVDLQKGLIVAYLQDVKLPVGSDASDNTGVVELPSKIPVEIRDFTLSCSLQLDREPGGDHPEVFCRLVADQQVLLSLYASPNGGIAVRGSGLPDQLSGGLPNEPRTGRKIPVTIRVQRDRREALSGVWIDGVERDSFPVPPGKKRLDTEALLIGDGIMVSGTVSNLRLYDRALTRPEIIALAQQDASITKPERSCLALVGGSEAVAVAESGWLDAMLSLIPAKGAPALRDLAWEGDTVFQQRRPLNFGSIAQQLARVQAQRALIMLGRQECMERGAAGVPAFREALTKLVQQCPRGVVIAGAVPFEKMAAPLPDLSLKNEVLRLYDEAMRTVAQENGGTFIDVAQSWRKQEEGWTRDGLTLNDHGTQLLADIIAFYLGNNQGPDPGEADLDRLRLLGRQKQALWHRYWRPANWAFLYGDRTTQPSSRDHLNPNIRWFPQELEQYRALIDAKETELWKLSQELRRKLP